MAKKKEIKLTRTAGETVESGDVNFSYNNVLIGSLSDSGSAVLKTENTVVKHDIEVDYIKNTPSGNIVNITNNSSGTPKIQGVALISSNGLLCNNAAAVNIPSGISKLFLYNAAQSGYDTSFTIHSVDDLYTITVNNGDPLMWDDRGTYSFRESSDTLITGQTYNVVIADKE